MFSSPIASTEFSKFAGILSEAFSQHHLLGFENSSTGILSPPPALFVVMLPKARLTSHSRLSGSRWVITPLWFSGSWRSFLYSSIQSGKIRLGADCGSDHELLIARFKFKLKKVGKTTRPFGYCPGPAPVDPGWLEGETNRQGKNLFIYKYTIRLGRYSVVGKFSGEKRLNKLVYMESQ